MSLQVWSSKGQPGYDPVCAYGSFDSLRPGREYRIELYLYPETDAAMACREAAIEAIKEGAGLQIIYDPDPLENSSTF